MKMTTDRLCWSKLWKFQREHESPLLLCSFNHWTVESVAWLKCECPSFSLLQWWDADDMSYLPTSNEGQVTMTPSPQIQIHDLSPSPILPWVSSINVPKNHCRVNSLVSPSLSPTVFWNHSDLALTWRDPSAHWSHMDLVESHKS